MVLSTARLRLRPWRESDLAPFAAMNADARVMERLGMRRDGEFDHLGIAEGNPLRRHVLYRLGPGR